MTKVDQFRLAAISTDEMPDRAIEQLFLDYEVSTEEELLEIVAILQKYRPAVCQKLSYPPLTSPI